MPQLSPEKYAEVAMKIDELAPLAEDGSLTGKGNGFILDQVTRIKEYGERTFFSPAQINWIEALHDEHVGTAEAKEPAGIDGRTGDMDDDIPF